MLKNVLLKTIRDNWRSAVAWGIGVGLVIYVEVAAYIAEYPTQLARNTAQGQLAPLLNTFRFMLGDPVDISTPGGFITFRSLGFVPLALGIWAILAATNPRNEEQRGIGDLLLTTPHPRSNVLTQQWGGFSLTLLVVTVLMWITGCLGWLATGDTVPVGNLLLTSINIGFATWLWGSLALLLSQFFISRGVAVGISIGLLVYTYFLNNIAPMFNWLSPLAYISPFHYYAINKPMVPGFSLDMVAFLISPMLALVFFGLAIYFVNRRDVAGVYPLFGQQGRKESNAPLNWHEATLGSLFMRNVRDLRWPTFWWTFGVSLYAVIIVRSAGQVMDSLRQMAKDGGPLQKLLSANFTEQDYIAAVLGLLIPIVAAAFVITQVASWTGDEENGIDEMVLTTPHQRRSVLLQRFVAVAVATIVMLGIIALSMGVTAAMSNVTLDYGKLAAAMLQLLPMALVVLGIGFAIAAWLKQPGGAVVIVSAYVIAAFILDLIGQFLKLPDAIPALSVFHDYGTPAITGLDSGVVAGLCLAALALLAISIIGFQRRDVAKG